MDDVSATDITFTDLERKLGVALIEQSGRRVRMLRTGNVLVREAHSVLRARQDAVNSTLADAGHPQRHLRIAHTFSLGLGFVPRVLAELLGEHPGLRFRCFRVADVRRVGAKVNSKAATVTGKVDPRTGLDARFSITHGIAVALTARPRLDHFTDAAAVDTEIASARAVIDVRSDDAVGKRAASRRSSPTTRRPGSAPIARRGCSTHAGRPTPPTTSPNWSG